MDNRKIHVALDELKRSTVPLLEEQYRMIYVCIVNNLADMVNTSVTVSRAQEVQVANIISQITKDARPQHHLHKLLLPVATWINTCHE
jgi:hypothetical protein